MTAPAPRSNPRLEGQGEAERVLLQALGSGRLPHAWLLTGPRGVGKATLAFRLARHLLSGEAGGGLFGEPQLAMDPGHPVFRQVAAGAHPDLLTLEPGVNEKTGKPRSEIVVETVRDAVEMLRRTASAGGWRVLVVDSADALNRNAANALLKILEEPAPRSLLLLLSHAPGALLPTIRSRCCHLPLAPLPRPLVQDLLTAYAPDLGEEEVLGLAGLAEGSIGRALALAEAGGLELYRQVMSLLATLPALDRAQAQAFADTLGKPGEGRAFQTAMELLGWWLARLVRAGAAGERPPALVGEEEGLAAKLLTRGNLADWLALWEKLGRLVARTDRVNLDRRQVTLAALLELEALAAA